MKKFLIITLKVLATVALAFLMLSSLSAMTKSTDGAGFFLGMAVACIFGIFALYKPRDKKQKATPRQQKATPSAAPRRQKQASPAIPQQQKQAPPAAPRQQAVKYDDIGFKLAGVTFEGRQKYLEAIAMYEEPYAACSYGIRQTEYKGDPAYDIVAELDNGKEKVLGKVPAGLVSTITKIYPHIISVDLDIHGGDDGKNYGAYCKITYKE